MKRIDIIADDFGLSPGVSAAIAELAHAGRISGTGCMAVFNDLTGHGKALSGLQDFQIGLHVTLTDFDFCGRTMPPVAALVRQSLSGMLDTDFIDKACDEQLSRFRDAFGRDPDFIDGHQHVHLFEPVRNWIDRTFATAPAKPWVRNKPPITLSNPVAALKSLVLNVAGRGHVAKLASKGMPASGYLHGFYDWKSGKADYSKLMDGWLRRAQSGDVIMCHPGKVDEILKARDSLTSAREVEFNYLASDAHAAAMQKAGVVLLRRGERAELKQ